MNSFNDLGAGQPHGRLIHLRTLVFVLLAYFVFSGAYLWQTYQLNKQYLTRIHQSQNRIEVKGVVGIVHNNLLDLRRSLKLFVNAHQVLIADLALHPKDEVLHDELYEKLMRYFPEMGGFTIADAQGNALFDDFGGTISDICRRDIQHFAQNPHAGLMQLHPNPVFPHVDLMVPINLVDKKWVFFINISAKKVVEWLQHVTLEGTHSLLVKIDRQKQVALIDFSEQGYRHSYPRQWQMSLSALNALPNVAMKKVPGTLWTAVVYSSQEALAQDQKQLRQAVMRALGLLVVLGAIFLPIILYFDYKTHKARAQVAYLAYHDPLTRLLNRLQFKERLIQSVQLAKRNKKSIAVLFLDLNGFKPINDKHGHEVGDEVLKVVAQRLKATLRASDVIARLGGDEFVVVLTDIHHPEDVLKIVDKLEEVIKAPIEVNGISVSVSVSIGYALLDDFTEADDAEKVADRLIKQADMHMYQVKEAYHQSIR